MNRLLLIICFTFLGISACKSMQNNQPKQAENPLTYHDAYWVAKMDIPGKPFSLEIINDMHIDTLTKRATVYAQSRILGKVVSPPQVGPDECMDSDNGRVCFHPNAVYLNGSSKELIKADGTGAWWVKHSWVLDGQGYTNWELKPKEHYGEGDWVEGQLLEDRVTMKIGITEEGQSSFYNLRRPTFDNKKLGYQVIRYGPKNADPNEGPVDMTPTKQFALDFKCKKEKSAFDNVVRGCP